MSDYNYLSVYAKSFSWAGHFLPKRTFKQCSALYDFCRVADNISDDDDVLFGSPEGSDFYVQGMGGVLICKGGKIHEKQTRLGGVL